MQSGEFDDPSYRANPVNRCYFCKVNLYGTLSRMGDVVAAGTNTDDLSDYRPGLIAAEEHNVIHPFVAADMAKSDVRALARVLGLGDLADLLTAPCLASRIQTGLRVEPEELATIDRVETLLRDALGNITLRCRRMHGGWEVALDGAVFDALTPARRTALHDMVRAAIGGDLPVTVQAYKQGSTFVHV